MSPYLLLSIVTPILPVIQLALLSSPGYMQLTQACLFISFSLGGLIFGTLADRLSRRHLLFSALFIAFIGALLIRFIPHPLSFLIGRILQGMGACALSVLPKTTLLAIYQHNRLDMAMSRTIVALGIGICLGPIMGGAITEVFSWGNSLYFYLRVPARAGFYELLRLSRSKKHH